MTRRSKIAKIVPMVNPSWLPFRVCSNDHAQLTGMPYIFFKIKNCLDDDLFISCDDRIGKMLHNICVSLNMAYILLFLQLQKLLTFVSKNTCELDIVLTRTVNILTTNKLVKLTMF